MASEDSSVFETLSEEEDISRTDRWARFFDIWVVAPLRIVFDDLRTLVGTVILTGFILMGTVGVIVLPYPEATGPSVLGPFQNWQYPLGTNELGASLLGRLVHATPAMLKMVLAGALFTTVIATVIGTVAGYKRGPTDAVLSTLSDVMLTIPGLPLVMVLAVFLQPESPWLVGILLSINAWAGLARSIRSEVIAVRTEPYVEASRVIGVPIHRIIFEDVLPNLMAYITVNFVVSGRRVIFGSVALYFLGLLPITGLNWGVMLQFAYEYGSLYLPGTLHWILIPTVTIALFTTSLLLIAQGAERVFNPRIRARHASRAVSDEGVTDLDER